MGHKPRPRYFVAWLSNHVDVQDDEPLKLRARTRQEARQIAERHVNPQRFSLESIMTWRELRAWDPEWASLLSGQRAINE